MTDVERHLTAAHGYLELGMPIEAADELEEIAPESRTLPEVLTMRYFIYSTTESWEMAEAVAGHMARSNPQSPDWWVNWAYASRRANNIVAAREIMSKAETLHPEVAIIHFNLGCYACQLGEIDEAKWRVGKAITLDRSFRAVALDDPDLEPLWEAFSKTSDA